MNYGWFRVLEHKDRERVDTHIHTSTYACVCISAQKRVSVEDEDGGDEEEGWIKEQVRRERRMYESARERTEPTTGN